MKIFILAAANDIHCVRWVNELSKNGNEVHLGYLSNHNPSIDKLDEKIQLHRLNFASPVGYYLNVIQLKIILNKVKPDILNAHYASGYGTLGRLVSYSPYLLSVYGSDVYDFPYKNKINLSIIRKNLNAADQLASTSHAMARQVNKLIDTNFKINITPFGVDVDRFCKNESKSMSSDKIIVGSIKKLSAKYGMKYGILSIDYLVNKLLPESGLNRSIKYYIYGDGDEKKELEELVSSKGLQKVVEFKGKIPNREVPTALNEFDIFLGNSILDSESFGVAIVEAMACEVPVIVTNVDGFSEVVDYGRAGILVDKKDYISMAEKIMELIKDANKMEQLGKIERRRVIELYNWIENVNHMEKVYSGLISDIKNVR